VEWKQLRILVENSNIIIPGLTTNIKTIYNTPDVNFRFIYFPKKYNLIVHPLYPIILNLKDKTKIINIKDISKSKDKKTMVRKLSNLEIFFYFIYIFSYLSIFSFFIYKIY
jgi:hypothetical protein